MQAYQFHRATVAQDERNVQRYQALFPDEQRIVDLATQAEQKLAVAAFRRRPERPDETYGAGRQHP